MRHIARLMLFLVACGGPEEQSITESAAQTTQQNPPLTPPIYTIRLHAVATADDDGTNPSPITPARVATVTTELNAIYQSTHVSFVFDPSTDFEIVNSTLLNQHFAVVGNIDTFTDPDVSPPTTNVAFNDARQAHADLRRDQITIFFAAPFELQYDTDLGKWKLALQDGGGSSSAFGRWVNWRQNVDGPSLAHEIGHYLNVPHPHVSGIATVPEAAAAIGAFLAEGHPIGAGLLALDGDQSYVSDTPPDTGRGIFNSVYGDACGPNGTIPIPVNFSNGTSALYFLAPDRSLVSGYFKGCGFDNHFSPDQAVRIRDSLEMINRRNLVSFKPSRYPMSLVSQDQESAGAISNLAAARIGRRRLVTATQTSSSLKLIVWDVGSAGSITRRGDVSVGTVSGAFAVTYGGLNQVLVAYRDGGGALVVKSYGVSSSGDLTLKDTETAGAVLDLAIVRLDRITFATPVRLSTGVLRVIAFNIFADGSITRRAHADGPAVTEIEAVSYNPFSLDGEALKGGATVFARTSGGNMSITSWKLDSANGQWAMYQADSDSAGAITDVAVAQMEFDLAASVVRTSAAAHKVIMWSTDYYGTIVRRGDYDAGACSRVAAAAVGTRLLVTGCRQPGTDAMVLSLLSISSTGELLTLRDTLTQGSSTELALVPVDDDKVVAVSRVSAGTLLLRSFAVEVATP